MLLYKKHSQHILAHIKTLGYTHFILTTYAKRTWKVNSVCSTATCLEIFMMVISGIFGNTELWVCRCIRRSPSFLNVPTIERTLNNKVVGIFSLVYIMEYLKTNSRSVFVIWINESQGFRKRTVRYPHKRNCI